MLAISRGRVPSIHLTPNPVSIMAVFASHRSIPRGTFALAALALLSLRAPAPAQQPATPSGPAPVCDVDLKLPGMMKDILSNALILGLAQPEAQVAAHLAGAVKRRPSSDELLRGCAKQFAIPEARLQAEVARFHHCNCTHAPLPGQQTLPGQHAAPVAAESVESAPITVFAKDVALHVVLHELGHALIREFDLPVLGNEETMADAFATHYLTSYLPERALAALKARVASLQIEANEVPRAEWPVSGEHDSDARRAFQIAALAVAADAERYAEVAQLAGMSERDIRKAQDYGAEIHRSWRRILAPLWMPADRPSGEARVVGDDASVCYRQLDELGLVRELREVVGRFDWHSQVTIRFVEGDGGAAWSRSARTVTVHAGYLQRFVAQGKSAGR
jgi:hypothetical protein